MIRRLVGGSAAVVLLALSACDDRSEPAKSGPALNRAAHASTAARADLTPPTAAARPSWAKPHTVVSFPKGMMACLTPNALQAALQRAANGHEPQMEDRFRAAGQGGDCIVIQPDTPVKVVGASYDPMIGMGVIEVVGRGLTSGRQGVYAMIVDDSFVQVVKEAG